MMAAPSINLQKLQYDLTVASLDQSCPAGLKTAIEQSVGSPVVLAVAVVDAADGLDDETLAGLPAEVLDAISRACEAVAAYRFWGRGDKATVLLDRINNLAASAQPAA